MTKISNKPESIKIIDSLPQDQKVFSLKVVDYFLHSQQKKPSSPVLVKKLPSFEVEHPFKQDGSIEILGHEADFLIKNSYLEGSSLKRNAEHLKKFTEFCKTQNLLSKKTLDRLEEFFVNLYYLPDNSSSEKDQESKAQEIAKKLHQLPPGKTLNMEGGWIKKEDNGSFGGHAVVYSFKKIAPNLYDIYIYNSGDGISDFHHKKIISNGIQENSFFCPYVKFQEVEGERIGLTFHKAYPGFFQKLIKLAKAPFSFETPSATRLYATREGFGGLQDCLVKADENTSFMKPQRSGTCTLKALFAAIHGLFASEEEYKIFKFLLRYSDLILLMEKQNALETDTEMQYLILEQARKLLRSLEKYSQLFSEEALAEAQERLSSIIRHIEKIPRDVVNLEVDPIKISSTQLKHLKFNEYPPTLDTFRKDYYLKKENINWLKDPPTKESFFEYLSHIKATFNPDIRIYATEQLVDVILSIKKEDLDKLSSDQAQQLLQDLHTVQRKYLQDHNPKYIQIHQACRTTCWALTSLAYEVSCLLSKELDNFQLAHNPLKEDRKHELYIELSPKETDRLEKIISRLGKSPDKPPIFDFPFYLNQVSKKNPLPAEAFYLQKAAGLENVHLSFQDYVELLIYEDELQNTSEGKQLILLRDMVYWANITCPSNLLNDSIHIYPVNRSFSFRKELSDFTIINKYDMISNPELGWFKLRKLDIPYKQKHPLIENPLTIQPENNTLSVPKDYFYTKEIPPATAANASLRASKLVYFVSQNLLTLKEPKEQKAFFSFLFSSLPGNSNEPIIYTAIKDKEFLVQFQDFINQGIESFSLNWVEKKPDILSCLFLLRMQRRVEELSPFILLETKKALLNEWLSRNDLTEEERRLIHLHKILQYKKTDPKNLSQEALQEIFTSWILCKDYLFTNIGDGRYQREEALRFILSLLPIIHQLDLTQLLSQVLNTKAEKLDLQGSWRLFDGFVFCNKNWGVDLLQGVVFKDNEIIPLGVSLDIRNLFEYRKIFSEMPAFVTEQNGAYLFNDTETGLSYRYIERFLQIYFKGSWYEYIENDRSNETPKILQSDYHCFANNKDRLFINKKTRKVCFATNEKGKLVNLENQSIVHSVLDNVSLEGVNTFEDPKFLLCETNKEGIKTVHFPRFVSTTGSDLSFIENSEGQFFLKGYPDYILVHPIEGILGCLKNALYCKNFQSGEVKIFVPILPKDPEENTIGPAKFLNTFKSDTEKQSKTKYFAEYTYTKGKLSSKDREAKTFLIYLYLIQRKEKEALELLKGLGRERSLSPIMKEILSLVINFRSTPASLAIAIKAGLYLRRSNDLSFNFHRAFETYRETYTNIPASLRLSQREINEFIFYPLNTVSQKVVSAPYPQKNIYYYDNNLNNSKNDFILLYKELSKATSKQERQRILATTPINLSRFSSLYKRLLSRIENFSGPLPDLQEEVLFGEDEFKWIENTSLNLPSSGRAESSFELNLVPKVGAIKNTDKPLAKKNSINRLQQSAEKAFIPSQKERFLLKTPIKTSEIQNILFKNFHYTIPSKSSLPSPLVISQPIADSYKKVVTHNIQKINDGIQKIEKVKAPYLEKGVAIEDVKQKLEKELEKLNKYLEKEQKKLLLYANSSPSNTSTAKTLSRLQKGQFVENVTWDRLIDCYLKADYKNLNPHLTKKQWDELDEAIRNHLIQATWIDQIQRAVNESDPNKVGSILQEKIAYPLSTSKESRVFLVYEYRSHNRIREEQIKGIQALLSNKNIVLQMIMGGGKTTVVTSILLELLPKGTIPFFIPLPAQFETQVSNLSQLQYEYYHKHIIPMQFTRDDLSLNKLWWIRDKLKDSQQHQEPIITTASSLECLQLEWLSLLDAPNHTLTPSETTKKEILTDILRIIKKDGVAILDEVDQILDLFTEHNFPANSKENLEPLYIDFIAEVFHLHLDPCIENALGLIKGKQSYYNHEDYKKKILPYIANKIFEIYQEKILLKDEHKQLFLEYILEGKLAPSLRSLLDTRMKKGNNIEKQSAELICLAKGIFFEILPVVITRMENKNYGIPKKSFDRKVVPFLGVDSPASTEFAGPYETACYHYLTALSSPITKEQIYHVASLEMKSLTPILQYSHIKLEETSEYLQFLSLTNGALDKVFLKDPKELEKAHKHLLEHPEKRLEIEKLFIRKHAGIYTEYYQSNPQSLFHLFSHAKGLTGTPWNSLTYPEPLRKNIFKDDIAESMIRAEFLTRSDLGSSKVYFTTSSNIAETLSLALKENPRKEKFRCLLDPIGFFKDLQNQTVAEEILRYFENDPSIENVLFFGREEGNMGIPGTPMILKKTRNSDGNFSIEILEGTSKEVLNARKIDPSKTITYYDERHCEATDIPQMPGALGLVVVGSALKDRDLLQTNLRLRDYMNSQEVDLIIPEQEIQNYPNNPKGRDILLQAQITQQIQIADEGFKSLSQKIHSIFREKAIESLLRVPTHSRAKKVRSAFVSKQSLSPYELFGKASEKTDPITAFSVYENIEKTKTPYLNTYITQKELKALKGHLQENLSSFPSLVSLSESIHGMQMEIAVQQEVELESELEIEYKFYQNGVCYKPFIEKSFPKIFSVSSLLQNSHVHYKKPYFRLFVNAPFKVTENFAYTETRLLPIFSKKQKPADQILITEDIFGLHATLVSAQEGALYKNKILAGEKNMWLYLPDGHLHVESSTQPLNTKKLEEILFEVNFFNGNSQYLLQHKEKMIAKIEKNPELKGLILHFLGIKAEQNPVEKAALARLTLELSKLDLTPDHHSLSEEPSYLLLWKTIIALIEELLGYLEEIYYEIKYLRYRPSCWEIPANKV